MLRFNYVSKGNKSGILEFKINSHLYIIRMDQHLNITEQVKLLKSVFGSRKDVFAISWKKANKSGYMPAYNYDPYMFRLHKNKGGSFQNYKDKSLLPLSDEQIMKHLH